MQKILREVICDCCGEKVKDLFGGYTVRRLHSALYDLCNDCEAEFDSKMLSAEWGIIRNNFNNCKGRPLEDGDKYEE